MMISLICPGCKEKWETPSGADWLEERQRLDKAGWRYGGERWRCYKCHIKWQDNRSKKPKKSTNIA